MTFIDRVQGHQITNHYNESFSLQFIEGNWYRCFDKNRWIVPKDTMMKLIKKFDQAFYKKLYKEFPEEYV